jgi:hypothetical protein
MVNHIRSLNIGATIPHSIGPLDVALMTSRGDDASVVVDAGDRPPAVRAIINVGSAAIDRTKLAIGADARSASAP